MNTVIRRIAFAILPVLLLWPLSACGTSYHAVVVNDRATEWIDASFLAAHYTGGIYLDEMDTVTDRETYPDSRTFTVDSQEAYAEIFKPDVTVEVDFETEMLLVCTFTSHYVRPVVITSLRRQGDTLSVVLKEKRKTQGLALIADAACAPYQRYVIIKLDKLPVTTVHLTIE